MFKDLSYNFFVVFSFFVFCCPFHVSKTAKPINLDLFAVWQGSEPVDRILKPHLLSGCHLLLGDLRLRFELGFSPCRVCREVRWGIQIQFKYFCRSMKEIQPDLRLWIPEQMFHVRHTDNTSTSTEVKQACGLKFNEFWMMDLSAHI